ncbi:DNA-binding response regulator [Pseudofrankia sp. EUN1h]|nr:DNA-binding response regulator [Pseudofrankia sp. EUN1h]
MVLGVEKITVFILDDHEIVRNGLRRTLERHDDIEVVGEAGLVAEALRRIPALTPNVAILDGRLPDGSGIDVCREIRSQYPGVACLILTSFDDDDALFSAIMAGAAGYVLKEIRGTDLVGAIRTVASGQSLLSPSVTQRVLARLREGPKQDPVLAELSPREREILGLVAEGLTNRQIGTRIHLSEKTVKNYVSSILDKLGLTSRTQAAVLASKHLGQDHPAS